MTSPFHRRHGAAKSHIAGTALQRDGTRTTAYRALVTLACAQCGAEIAVGALFSRHVSPRRPVAPLRTFGPSVAPVPICTACGPLRLEGDTGTITGTPETGDSAEEGSHGRDG